MAMVGQFVVVAYLLSAGLIGARELPFPCGTDTKFEVVAEEKVWAKPEPLDADRGRLYVLAERNDFYNLGLAINGKWSGANWKKRATYFAVDLPPGEYSLCSVGSLGRSHALPGFLHLNIEVKKIYYVEQVVEQAGIFSSKVVLRLLQEEQAIPQLRRSRRAMMVSPRANTAN